MTRQKKVPRKKIQPRRFGWLTFSLILFLAAIIAAGALMLGYKAGYNEAKEQYTLLLKQKDDELRRARLDIDKTIQGSLSKPKTPTSEAEDFQNAALLLQEPKKQETLLKPPSVNAKLAGKPRLVIILDDIAFDYQIKAIKSLELPITLSFFPPNHLHPDTAYMAAREKSYMVHLPLEALSYKANEPGTLLVNSTSDEIQKRIKKIREWFPNAKYINNHTGSKFTADKAAMERLIEACEKYNFLFVDSKTTPASKVKSVVGEYNMTYVGRDIFLDNKPNVAYIQGQLKEAVEIAKKSGYAIAIGHPHPKTIEALGASKNLLKEVEVVTIDKIL